jgi:cytidylate kinase
MGGISLAIDGPAGSGKSSVARAVASRLGFANLDTGATYRAVALMALREGIDPDDGEALLRLGGRVALTPGGVLVDGTSVADWELRTPEVSAAASRVSAHPGLRRVLVGAQREAVRRELEEARGVVVEGRDIGTVVLPDAPLKVFLSASAEERARRRALQSNRQGELGRIREAMRARDERDASRAASPLKPAPDAVVLDTTGLTLDEVVDRVVALAREAAADPTGPRRAADGE